MAHSDKRVIWTDSNTGYLCIMQASDNCKRTLEEIAEKDVPDGETYYIIDATALPTDESFRDAWTYTP